MASTNLREQLQSFQPWQLAALTAAQAERMFPNYQLFAQLVEGAGDADVVRMALDKVWDHLCQRGKVNFETQMERVEAQIPNVEDYDMYGVYPALDAVVAVCAAINQVEKATVEEALNSAQLSEECVATYLEVIAEADLSDEELVRFINTHELMEQELDFRQQVIGKLSASDKQQAKLLDAIRDLANNEGVSNIGICEQE
ncbi:MAG: YjaG family protein [Motiliproteus sp.]|nr:YjaG family protein [Motiliproteus sp.]MCW9052284.1 YjaG family protein [Motiliproteus sp.]